RPRTLPEVQGGVTARNSPNGQPGKGNGACTAADPDTDPCRVGRKRHSVVNHIRIGRAQFGKTGRIDLSVRPGYGSRINSTVPRGCIGCTREQVVPGRGGDENRVGISRGPG